MSEAAQSEQRIAVTAKDLPLHCPMPRTPIWAYHPRVFLEMGTGQAKCPYCGTIYTLDGAPPKGH